MISLCLCFPLRGALKKIQGESYVAYVGKGIVDIVQNEAGLALLLAGWYNLCGWDMTFTGMTHIIVLKRPCRFSEMLSSLYPAVIKHGNGKYTIYG